MEISASSSANEIIKDINNNPEKWHIRKSTIIRENGLEIWVGNGWTFLSATTNSSNFMSMVDRSFGLLEKLRLWKAYKRFVANREGCKDSEIWK